MRTLKFRVKNLLSEDYYLDCANVNDILDSHGIDSDTIVQSNDNDNEWIVLISEENNQLNILQKKNHFLGGVYKHVEYSLHFDPFEKVQPSLLSESEDENPSSHINYFQEEGDQNFAGNLERRPSNTDHLRTEIEGNLERRPSNTDHLRTEIEGNLERRPSNTDHLRTEIEGNLERRPSNTDHLRTEIEGNLERRPSNTDHLRTEIEDKFPAIDLDADDDKKTILVQDVPEDIDLKFLEVFLENKRLSGGGKIQNIMRVGTSMDVEVTFENVDVIDEVLKNSPLKIADLTFHTCKKPIIQKEEKKESNVSEENTIEVHGVAPVVDLEILRLYFENPKKSGGGQITKDLIRDSLTGITRVTFASSEDANRVVNRRKHIFNGKIYEAKWHCGSEGKQFFLSDVKADVMKDSIVNFLESKAKISVENIVKMETETVWLVNCSDVVNLIQVQQLCKENMMKFMSETYPKVSPVPASETIRVKLLQRTQDLNKEMIHLYFQGRIHEGQEIKSVEKLSADQFLVAFNDPTVVPEVCARTHKIFGTELEVLPYIKLLQNEICEHCLLESSFVLDLMKKYKLTVETMLQPDVKPIWPSSVGRALKIEYNKSNSREKVLKTVRNLLQNIYEETFDLSAEMFEKAKELTAKELSNAIVSFDSSNQTMQIAAFGEEAILQLKEALHTRSSGTVKDILHLESYKISLLFASKFLQKIFDEYPGTRFESLRAKLIISGKSSDFPEIKNQIYKFLNDIQCSSVRLPKHSASLLRKKQVINYIKEKLKKRNCIASWEIKEDDLVMCFCMSSNHLSIVSQIFQSSFKLLIIEDAKEEVLKQEASKKFLTNIQKDYADLFYLDQKSLTGVAVDCVENKIQSEIKHFFRSSVHQEKRIPFARTHTDFLKENKMQEIKEFCQSFGSQNLVMIKIEPDDQIRIRTSEKNMAKAVNFINGLVKRFEEMKSTMDYLGVEKGDDKNKQGESTNQLQRVFQMIFNEQTIFVYAGDMTRLSVDAIVNAANREMRHGGGIAKSIVDKGGSVIQTESDKYLSHRKLKSIDVGDAIITTAGNLPSKYVIHTVGPEWVDGKRKEKILLSKAVKVSLEIADQHQLTSIAFPAISAGSYRYPLDDAVRVIVSAVKEYLDDHSKTHLKNITFVDTRTEVTRKFQQHILQIFIPADKETQKTAVKSGKSDTSTPTPTPKQTPTPTPLPKQTPTPKPTSPPTSRLVIKKGSLELTKADIVVNSIAPDLDFSKGQLARAILQAAGQEIQIECNTHSQISPFEVIVTKGYRLPCNKVFHINLPHRTLDTDTVMRKYIEKCLQQAEFYKASSIAFPSLGTGQLHYPPAIVANQMVSVAQQHLLKPSSLLREIAIIIYPSDDYVFKAFESELKNLPNDPSVDLVIEDQVQKSSIVQTVGNFLSSAAGYFTNPGTGRTATQNQLPTQVLPKRIPDFMLGPIAIYLINGDLLNETTDAIVHCTDASFGLKGAISRCLSRTSGSAFVRDCQSKGLEMSRRHYAVTTAHNLKCRHIIHLDIISQLSEPEKILETCFSTAEMYKISSLSVPQLATNGKDVPLEEMASAMVHVIPTLKKRYLKQVNVVLYQSKMVSTLKSAIVSAQSGNIVPTKMTASDLLKVTSLQTRDAEYKTVEKEFLSSLNRTTTIVSIEKINNKPLKIQYEAQLSKIKTINGLQAKNERNLWHGTKDDAVIKICKNGFDRGYCGTNGTWHGQGVYFAVESHYSDQNTYSPPDTKGHKHMFMCRVATGNFVQGTPNMKVLPLIPNATNTYDSAVNRIGAPTVFIIFNDVQAYPAYHITYC